MRLHPHIKILGLKIITHLLKIFVALSHLVCYLSNTFDENLLKHISHRLADDARRESDTS